MSSGRPSATTVCLSSCSRTRREIPKLEKEWRLNSDDDTGVSLRQWIFADPTGTKRHADTLRSSLRDLCLRIQTDQTLEGSEYFDWEENSRQYLESHASDVSAIMYDKMLASILRTWGDKDDTDTFQSRYREAQRIKEAKTLAFRMAHNVVRDSKGVCELCTEASEEQGSVVIELKSVPPDYLTQVFPLIDTIPTTRCLLDRENDEWRRWDPSLGEFEPSDGMTRYGQLTSGTGRLALGSAEPVSPQAEVRLLSAA